MTRHHWRIPQSFEAYYGLGVNAGKTDGWDWFGHSGGFQGYISRTCSIPACELTISILSNSIDGGAPFWMDGAMQILRVFRTRGAANRQVRDWTGRWWTIWGATDLVPAGNRVLVANPQFINPFMDAAEIEVTGRDTGKLAWAAGYSSHGEPVRRIRDKRGRISDIWIAGANVKPASVVAREIAADFVPRHPLVGRPEDVLRGRVDDARVGSPVILVERDRSGDAGDVPLGWKLWARGVVTPTIDYMATMRQLVRKALRDSTLGRYDRTYSRPHRRQAAYGDFIMSSFHQPRPRPGFLIDTSSSMQDTQLSRAVAELAGLTRQLGYRSEVVVACCDVAVHGVRKVFGHARVELYGGGGTDIGNGIRWFIETCRPVVDLLVIVSDCQTAWPDEPPPFPAIVVRVGDGAPPAWGGRGSNKVITIEDAEPVSRSPRRPAWRA